MVNYKDLGLVNTREMFKRAVAGGYAIPAFNFNTMEQMQAIVMAAVETKSPVIMQVSKGARNYANASILRYMAEGAVAYAKELGCEHPEIVLHLDHGDSFELCKDCIDMGFSSVMIDGSHLPYEENVALAKKVVDYAHQFDVTVEAELGVLAGVEDEVSAAEGDCVLCAGGRSGAGGNGAGAVAADDLHPGRDQHGPGPDEGNAQWTVGYLERRADLRQRASGGPAVRDERGRERQNGD